MEQLTYLSWNDIDTYIGLLTEKIKGSGFVPDYLVGITVGGLAPLALLAKKLRIRDILTISAHSHHGHIQGKLEITNLPNVDIRGKKILLIDEISDTGETLKKVSDIFKNDYGVGELKTATIAINSARCRFIPDFWVYEDDRWIVFPWENESKKKMKE